ncbi:cytochrome c oxidase subunit II [Agaricicola taiwanensis]|uniref:Cytochrome aa3 subunit 2 n=1 Tax=Agaricicola taiwanensis TaxID=591372 RepID=A0A8J2YL66_9RHOB|nr:cytochrome c oxidase subunit II [Agaricicola taiwanensis]GGE49441.1 cytochrome c oxidase subunit II [Agaricicola taiwanensis]
MMHRLARLLWLASGALALTACAGEQSAFTPKGIEAERIDTLFWVMTIAGGVIFAVVAGLTLAAMLGGPRLRAKIASEKLVIGAGILFPVVSLTALLFWGFMLMRAGEATEPSAIRVSISGERWWWRVTYEDEAGRTVDTANELHLPVGQPVTLTLTSPDVIHSFWVPQLAGKLDMIPGRENILTLTATQPGISRGQCAEYCGGAHALMSFYVVAQEPDEFRRWLDAEAGAARPPEGAEALEGQRLFAAHGCGACHAVRGTEALGTIGPDLTHVGSRHSLAAAALPNRTEDFARWIRDSDHIKPENLMPPYRIFSEEELAALAAYLEGLR